MNFADQWRNYVGTTALMGRLPLTSLFLGLDEVENLAVDRYSAWSCIKVSCDG